jgi:hypothetical protein
MNLELYNFITYTTTAETTSTYGSNYVSLMSGLQQHQQQSFNDTYTALILEEAEMLYNTLITKLNNEVIAVSAAAIRKLSLSTPLSDNDKQI